MTDKMPSLISARHENCPLSARRFQSPARDERFRRTEPGFPQKEPKVTKNRGEMGVQSIPKGLHHSAQGCEERATLGIRVLTVLNPERLPLTFSRIDPLNPILRKRLIDSVSIARFLGRVVCLSSAEVPATQTSRGSRGSAARCVTNLRRLCRVAKVPEITHVVSDRRRAGPGPWP